MEIRALIGRYRPDGLYRIAAERINAKCQQKNASEKLQVKDVLVDIIKDKTHPVARQQGIGNVAQGGSYPRHKTIPPSFIQSTLNA